jgi:PAS domain S-box-containing protein
MLSITAIAIESAQLIGRLREREFFFDLSMDIYCIFDTKSERIVQANPTFTLVTGYSADELASRHYLDFVHPDDLVTATSAVEVLNAAGRRVHAVVYRFLCKDGCGGWRGIDRRTRRPRIRGGAGRHRRRGQAGWRAASRSQ